MIEERLARFVRWRWTTTAGLVAIASIPLIAATLLVPEEITLFSGDGGSIQSPRPEGRTQPRASIAAIEHEMQPAANVTATPSAPRPRTPFASASKPGEVAAIRARTGGPFVPLGETDDSQPVEPRRVTRR